MMHAVSTPARASGPMDLPKLLDQLAATARRIELDPKSILYDAAEPADRLFLILQGQIRSHQVGPGGARRLIQIHGTGDWCGSAALARRPIYGERAEAAVLTRVAVIPVERLFVELTQHPMAANELVRQLADRLAAFRQEAAELVFDDCNRRLVRTLQRLSQSPAATRQSDGVVLRITHQQLAQAMGVARETVSLALSQLRRRNLLRTGRNQLFFNPNQLEFAEH